MIENRLSIYFPSPRSIKNISNLVSLVLIFLTFDKYLVVGIQDQRP